MDLNPSSSDLASTTRLGANQVATSNGGEPHPGGTNTPAAAAPTGSHANGGGDSHSTHKMIIYNLATKTSELSVIPRVGYLVLIAFIIALLRSKVNLPVLKSRTTRDTLSSTSHLT